MQSHWGLEGLQCGLLAGLPSLHSAGTRSCSKSGAFPNTTFLFNQFRKKLTALEAFCIIGNMHSGKEGWRNSWYNSSKKANLSTEGPDRGWPAAAWCVRTGEEAQRRPCGQVAGERCRRPAHKRRRERSIKQGGGGPKMGSLSLT